MQKQDADFSCLSNNREPLNAIPFRRAWSVMALKIYLIDNFVSDHRSIVRFTQLT